MITKSILTNAFRTLVITSPLNRQFNMFAVLEDGSFFTTPNLPVSMRQYNQGYFWARNWVDSGADPNRIEREWPAMVMEFDEIETSFLEAKNAATINFWIVLADVLGCANCEELRSPEEVDEWLEIAAIQILRELSKYVIYTVDENYMFLTTELADALTDEGYSVVKTCYDFTCFIVHERKIRVKSLDAGLLNGIRALSFQLTLSGFCPETDTWNYEINTVDQKAITKCQTC